MLLLLRNNIDLYGSSGRGSSGNGMLFLLHLLGGASQVVSEDVVNAGAQGRYIPIRRKHKRRNDQILASMILH